MRTAVIAVVALAAAGLAACHHLYLGAGGGPGFAAGQRAAPGQRYDSLVKHP